MIQWQWAKLEEFSVQQLYAVFAARESVFVVEQSCPYQELDGLDLQANHLVGWSGDEIAAYLRVLGPGVRYAEPSVGRVLTAKAFRGTGAGRTLAQERQDAPAALARLARRSAPDGSARPLALVPAPLRD